MLDEIFSVFLRKAFEIAEDSGPDWDNLLELLEAEIVKADAVVDKQTKEREELLLTMERELQDLRQRKVSLEAALFACHLQELSCKAQVQRELDYGLRVQRKFEKFEHTLNWCVRANAFSNSSMPPS